MPAFRKYRISLRFAHQEGIVDCEEFFLYDLNTCKNQNLSYWKYNSFDLDSFTDEECRTEFRFSLRDIYAIVYKTVIISDFWAFSPLNIMR